MDTLVGRITHPYALPTQAKGPAPRLTSIDIARGLVMILMAIDHVRVYSGITPGGPDVAVLFTRWITHFCAPAFAFLAGTGAFFNGQRLGDMRALSGYLAVRGAILVVLDLTVIRFGWTFNFDYASFTMTNVLWMLGWSMIALAALVRTLSSATAIGFVGVGIIALQQVFGLIPRMLPDGARARIAPVYDFIYPTGVERDGGIGVLYVLIPWIGVMAAGYGFGLVMQRERHERDRFLTRLGLALTALFLGVGTAVALVSGGEMPFYQRLLNQQKYPASQLFLLMTLGPTIALLPVFDRMRGPVAKAIQTIGRVPLFFYVLHIPLIHVTALLVNQLRDGTMHHDWYATAPFVSVEEGQRWPLWLLYAVWLIDVGILYVVCRQYARAKAGRPSAWMRYL